MEIKVYNGMDFDQDISVNNYADTFFLCHVGKNKLCENMVTEHTLVYMVSGEMDVFLPDGRTIHYKKGDTAFLRRNHKVNKEKLPNGFGIAMCDKYTLPNNLYMVYHCLIVLMLYILSFIAVMAWRLCATFVVLFILTVPDLEYYALSLHRLLLDYPINLYIYNLQHTL
ncbi:MAG: hypothetical protein HXN29_10550 [Prevotella histicola]|uniref:hypothetical protein n=1 Tax=Prevotella histicola TaxID=470565 RepID=UPI001CB1AF3A|nr:hypothetical protein [Prevotella histicola]MBF1399022.1 hypothetical protein [Prevotella histicola]